MGHVPQVASGHPIGDVDVGRTGFGDQVRLHVLFLRQLRDLQLHQPPRYPVARAGRVGVAHLGMLSQQPQARLIGVPSVEAAEA